MKTNFKPLGLAAAVATVVAGYAGVANADHPNRARGNLGDMAIIPYYSVQDDWVTGIHIINSAPNTQVVKLRFRRAEDSADALDINLIMSPYDEWTGFLDDSTGNIVLATDDQTCTAPQRANGRFEMPPIYRAGAEEGYVEVIGMGVPISEAQPIALAAKHVAGIPRNCTGVASNFFANAGANPTGRGNINNALTHQTSVAGEAAGYAGAGATCITAQGTPITAADTTLSGVCQNNYVRSANGLKVSYFLRDAASGIEFGGDAVHTANFANAANGSGGGVSSGGVAGQAWMTNQETGLFSGDVYGFDYPDLDGGPWVGTDSTTLRGTFNNYVRTSDGLGVNGLLNDWSVASARNVSTDWVVTMPGQYTMLDFYVLLTQAGDFSQCGRPAIVATGQTPVPLCDFRDIPVIADLTLYDREEGVIVPEEGDLVISPAPPGTVNQLIFPFEVNVVEWTDGSNTPVLGSDYNVTVDPTVLGEFGWASLAVASNPGKSQNVCGWDPVTFEAGGPFGGVFTSGGVRSTCVPAVGTVPVTGVVVWERSFPQNPDGNYGRLIDHSFF